MTPNIRQQTETRFVELMTELFRMDEAEALDFGIYRVIRRHNQQVKAFLGEIVGEKEFKALRGGRLTELLETARSEERRVGKECRAGWREGPKKERHRADAAAPEQRNAD